MYLQGPRDILFSVYVTAKVTCLFLSPHSLHLDDLQMWCDWWQGGLLVPVPAAWTWQVWPQPVSLSEAPNPYLPNHFKTPWIESNANVICVILLHSNKTTNLITSLPLSSPFKDRWRGGAIKMGGKSKRAGAVFMGFSPSSEEEVKTFSPLTTRETTWRLNLSGVCVCVCVY